jgi:hypothetical protein
MSQAIPENVRARLLKMIAVANDERGNEHVAAAASAKVQALLSEYNLEMSQVLETDDDADVNPDAMRENVDLGIVTASSWQNDLLSAIAGNNFCLHISRREYDEAKGGATDRRTHRLIGRAVNVTTTRQIYSYLAATMERLNPYTDKRTKSHRSWLDGCTSRLGARLYDQRCASESASLAAAREKQGDAPRGNGSDIVLSDVYSSEDDLNYDYHYSKEPGTTARERKEREARYAAERAARANDPVKVVQETAKERREREAQERRWKKQWERESRIRESKIDRNAYAMGQNAGQQIGLDVQVGTHTAPRLA